MLFKMSVTSWFQNFVVLDAQNSCLKVLQIWPPTFLENATKQSKTLQQILRKQHYVIFVATFIKDLIKCVFFGTLYLRNLKSLNKSAEKCSKIVP